MSAPTSNTASIQEDRLVQNARAGDSQAFGELVIRYQRLVYNLALRSLGDPEEAQDAAQEAFLRAWRGLPGFEGKARFSTWLYRITANLCLNRRPRLRRELYAISIEENLDTGLDLPEESSGPAALAETRELRLSLQAAVDKLPESQRLLIVLRYQQDLSYEEISEVLGVSIGTVKTGLFRAKQQLRSALTRQEAVKLEAAICAN